MLSWGPSAVQHKGGQSSKGGRQRSLTAMCCISEQPQQPLQAKPAPPACRSVSIREVGKVCRLFLQAPQTTATRCFVAEHHSAVA